MKRLKETSNQTKLYLLLSLIFLLTGCSKKDDQNVDPVNEIFDGLALEQFFLDNRNESVQSFTFTHVNGFPSAVIGQKGSVLELSTLTQNNQYVNNETVECNILEVFSKSDMMLMNLPSMGKINSNLFEYESKGMLYAEVILENGPADKTGAFIWATPYTYETLYPANAEAFNNSNLFIDATQPFDLATNITISISTLPNNSQNYALTNFELGWLSVGETISSNISVGTISAQAPEGFTNENSVVFVKTKDNRLIVLSLVYNSNLGLFTLPSELEVDQEVDVLFLTSKGDDLYYSLITTTLQQNETIEFQQPEQIDDILLKSLINTL